MEKESEFKEKLSKLAIGAEKAETVEQKTFIPQSPTGYSENPDEEIEEWSNVDEPLDEGWAVSDEEYANQVESSLEQEEDKNTASQAQLQQLFTCGDGRTISVAQLKGTVIADFSVSDGFTATTLQTTGDWDVFSDKVVTYVENAYEKSILEKKSGELSAVLTKVCAKPMQFVVELKQKTLEPIAEPKEIPPQVKILVDTFKGTILNK